jgi:hypothetical protein
MKITIFWVMIPCSLVLLPSSAWMCSIMKTETARSCQTIRRHIPQDIFRQKYWGFGHFPSSGILENTTFRKLDMFPSSGEGGGEDTYSVGPECQMMEKVQNPSTSVCYTPSSEPFRIYNIFRFSRIFCCKAESSNVISPTCSMPLG